MKRPKVLVIYKSGAEVVLKCSTFKVTQQGGAITELTYADPRPRPLHIGINEIAAVYEL